MSLVAVPPKFAFSNLSQPCPDIVSLKRDGLERYIFRRVLVLECGSGPAEKLEKNTATLDAVSTTEN